MQLWNRDTMNAPWGVTSRRKLAVCAVRFFDPKNYVDSCKTIGKTPNEQAELFSVSEFMKYLENKKVFAKKPNVLRAFQVLQKMSSAGVLHNVASGRSAPRFLSDCYLFLAFIRRLGVRDTFGLLRLLEPIFSFI